MDDYIKREDAFNIKNYLKRFGCFGDNGFVEIEGVLIALSKIPSADVVPVVRCKDCKYGKIDDSDFPNQYLCEYRGSDWNNGDHYCSEGERKDND